MALHYTNSVQFPETVQGFVDLGIGASCTSSAVLNYCDGKLAGYIILYYPSVDNPDGLFELRYKAYRAGGDYCGINFRVKGVLTGNLELVSQFNSGCTSSFSSSGFTNEYPLYFAVTPVQTDGIIIGGTLLAIAFFTFVYKIFKRVLFR